MAECTKKTYDTLEEGISAAGHLRRTKGRRLFAYKCKHCPGFHLGRPTREDSRRAIQKKYPNGRTLEDIGWEP